MTDLIRRDLRRLHLLARRDRRLVRASNASDTKYEVREGDDCTSHIIGASWVRDAEGRGWLDRIDGDCWVLSRRGRAYLKAGMSILKSASPKAAAPKPAQNAAHPSQSDLSERAGTVLGWLRSRVNRQGEPLISEAEFAAGERFRADFMRANALPSVTARLSVAAEVRAPLRDADNGLANRMDQLANARQKVLRALEAVGPDLGNVLIETCCHERGLKSIEADRGWPQRSGKVVLTLALRQLAEHYGLASRGRSLDGKHRIVS